MFKYQSFHLSTSEFCYDHTWLYPQNTMMEISGWVCIISDWNSAFFKLSTLFKCSTVAGNFFSKCKFMHFIGIHHHFSKFHTELYAYTLFHNVKSFHIAVTAMHLCIELSVLVTADTKLWLPAGLKLGIVINNICDLLSLVCY